jgi:hypothetical protein
VGHHTVLSSRDVLNLCNRCDEAIHVPTTLTTPWYRLGRKGSHSEPGQVPVFAGRVLLKDLETTLVMHLL